MNKGTIELKLKLFLSAVRNGRTPSKDVMDFVADGVEAFLKDSKPWQVKTGRKQNGAIWSEQRRLLQVYAMSEIGVSNARLQILFDNLADRTLRKYKEAGKASANAYQGEYVLSFAIDDLLARKDLKTQEKRDLREMRDTLFEDETERLLDDNGDLI